MTKSFDGIELNDCTWKTHSDDYYLGYEAGQQSKQYEIDELQKRIDEALSCADKCTWNIALVELKKILKGEETK